jgi:protein gp37
MAENSDIEWTDSTFNPWIGCQKVAPECDHCYAETRDQRFHRGAHWGPKAPRQRTSAQNWNKPRRWNRDAAAFMETHGRRQRVFCASLADVFDNAVDPSWRADLWDLIRECPDLDWLILTKRPQNITKMLPEDWGDGWPHVWLGTSAGTQETANKNIPALLSAPAAVRFLSAEPLLGPINLKRLNEYTGKPIWDALRGIYTTGGYLARSPAQCSMATTTTFNHPSLDWVICGGESGKDARPMHPDWARSLRDQCQASGTPFLFKQAGEWTAWQFDSPPLLRNAYTGFLVDRHVFIPADTDKDPTWNDGLTYVHEGHSHAMFQRAGKKAAGRLLDGIEHNDFPNSPAEQKGGE